MFECTVGGRRGPCSLVLCTEVCSSSSQVVETVCQRTIQFDNTMQFPVFWSSALDTKHCVLWSNTIFVFVQLLQVLMKYFTLVAPMSCEEFKTHWESDDGSLNIHCFFHLFPAEELSQAIKSTKNWFTLELLIGLAWNAEQTLYLYFLDLIKLHWKLYVYHIVPNTLECLQ